MKRTPLRQVSAKKRRQDAQRRKLRVRFLADNPDCGALLGGCQGGAVEVHEVIQRSVMPNASVMPRLYLGLCHPCHAWISDNFGPAWQHGYVLQSWQNTDEWLRTAATLRTMHCARDRQCETKHMTTIINKLIDEEIND